RAAPVIHALSLRSPTSHALLSPMIPPPPSSTLFPYTTLFRSVLDQIDDPRRGGPGDLGGAGGEEDVGAEGDLGDATVGAGPLERLDLPLERDDPLVEIDDVALQRDHLVLGEGRGEGAAEQDGGGEGEASGAPHRISTPVAGVAPSTSITSIAVTSSGGAANMA